MKFGDTKNVKSPMKQPPIDLQLKKLEFKNPNLQSLKNLILGVFLGF